MVRRTNKRSKKSGDQPGSSGPDTSVLGGRFVALSEDEIEQIKAAAFKILESIGISEAPQSIVEILTNAGARLSGDQRVLFPSAMINSALGDLAESIVLCAQDPSWDLDLSRGRVFTGSGGASPLVVDRVSGDFRESTLQDLAETARLCDKLHHCHFFARTLVARDMGNDRELDLNTAFVSLTNTKKHVIVSASKAEHVDAIADIAYCVAGSEQCFRDRPILSLNINHVVPPLRFHDESADVIVAAVKAGIPVQCNVFGQLGASSPVTMAGSVAQTIAETLAGVILAWAVDPNAKVVGGPRPMITDLRTGGMSGGSGEQAMATAMAAQVMNNLGLSNSVIAGATDSKTADAQSGFEKATSITVAAHAGANLITQALGTQAGLMAASFHAYVIDNDMCGAILKSSTHMQVSQETLALDSIAAVVKGEGHFLGEPQTYARMKTDFRYPDVANRMGVDEWAEAGKPNLVESAKIKVEKILSAEKTHHVPLNVRAGLAEKYNLQRLD